MRDIHIGHEVERRVAYLGMNKKDFAKQMGMQAQNLKRSIFDKEDLDTGQLRKISEILSFNFFRLYCDDATDYTVLAAGANAIAAVHSDIKTSDAGRLEERIAMLQAVLAEKERLIQYLMRQVDELK